MLSIVDLLQAGTLDPNLAAYLTTAISRGSSFLVGAYPGGAGKTTVMTALLNFVPPDCRLRAADSGATVREALGSRSPSRFCYICHEIGAGPYYAYLWGRDARDFFALPAAGSMIATNLHVDTLEQCRHQLCDENGVKTDDFHRCRLCLFLVREGRGWGSSRRRIATVCESDGQSPHRLVWQWNRRADRFERCEQSKLAAVDDPYCSSICDFISEMAAESICSIGDVRSRFLEFARHNTARS